MHAIYKSFGILNLGSKPINDHVLGPRMRWQDLISFSHFGNGEWSSSLPNINSLTDLKINSLGHYFFLHAWFAVCASIRSGPELVQLRVDLLTMFVRA